MAEAAERLSLWALEMIESKNLEPQVLLDDATLYELQITLNICDQIQVEKQSPDYITAFHHSSCGIFVRGNR